MVIYVYWYREVGIQLPRRVIADVIARLTSLGKSDNVNEPNTKLSPSTANDNKLTPRSEMQCSLG